jgi:hypothetical protein
MQLLADLDRGQALRHRYIPWLSARVHPRVAAECPGGIIPNG